MSYSLVIADVETECDVVKIGPVLVAVGKIWGDAFGKLGSQIVYVTPEGGVVNCRGFIPRAGAKAAFG